MRVHCANCEQPVSPPSTRYCATHRKEHGQRLLAQLNEAVREGETALKQGDVVTLNEIGGGAA